MRRPPTTDTPLSFADINPGETYSTDDVGRLLKVSHRTITRMVSLGRLKPLPMPMQRPYRFLGASLLALLGDQAKTLEMVPESPTARTRRANEAMDRFRKISGRKAK